MNPLNYYMERNRMREVVLLGSMMVEPERAHTYLEEELDFPDYYGKNLDALYDCLADLRNMRIKIDVDGNENEYLSRILQVFEDAAEDNEDIEVYVI